MSLVKSLISSDKYGVKCPYKMTPKGICIHNTANDAPAKNEVSYMKSNNNEVSYHIAIDDLEAIQAIPLDRNAWHAGDGGNGEGNRNYIAVEICYSKSGGSKFVEAEKRAAKEVAALLKQYGWGVDKVRDHRSFSGKNCPHRTNMTDFKYLVQIELNLLNSNINTPNQNPSIKYRVKDTLGKQLNAYSNLDYAKKFAADKKAIVYDINNNVVVSYVPSNKKYLNLNPHVASWRVYPTNVEPIIQNACGSLAPKQFGGLSYEILGNPQTDVYTIQTQSCGRVNIYAPRDADSSITNNPLY